MVPMWYAKDLGVQPPSECLFDSVEGTRRQNFGIS